MTPLVALASLSRTWLLLLICVVATTTGLPYLPAEVTAAVTTEQGIDAATALLSLVAGSVAALFVANEPVNALLLGASPRRRFAIRIAQLVWVTSSFTLCWTTSTNGQATALGLRNAAAALCTGLVLRRLHSGPMFAAAGIAWMFPAVLSGSSTVGQVIGFALISYDSDIVIAGLLLLVATTSAMRPFARTDP